MNVSTIPAATFAAVGSAAVTGAAPAAPAPEADQSRRRAETARVLLGDDGRSALPEFKRYALAIHIEEETNRIVVQVIDPETKQVLRSVPPEDLMRSLQNAVAAHGALVDRQV